jgi:hypothetical protein
MKLTFKFPDGTTESTYFNDVTFNRMVKERGAPTIEIFTPPPREEMIEKLVEVLPKWLERDAHGFWEHVGNHEKTRLRKLNDESLIEEFEAEFE